MYHYRIIGLNVSTNINLKESETGLFEHATIIPRNPCAAWFPYFTYLFRVLFGPIRHSLLPNSLMRESRRLLDLQYSNMLANVA